MSSPHDGVIRGNGRLNLELAPRPGWVDIHVLDTAEKPVAIDGAVMHVATHPASGASRWSTLAPKGGHFELPWTATDGPLEDAALEITLARSKPPLDERFEIHLASTPARKLDVKTRIATAAWAGAVRRIATWGRIDGYVAILITVAPTIADRGAIEREIERALASHPEIRVSQRLAAGSAISTGGGGHAHLSEATIDPTPSLALDVMGSADNTGQLLLRQWGEKAVLWQTAVPLSP